MEASDARIKKWLVSLGVIFFIALFTYQNEEDPIQLPTHSTTQVEYEMSSD
ncbi:hypothetical protein [Desertibacillus haloalkaliphilus]|uniref:hypothetical protein n=1 Tax=Desertibacillus haloalkaliphilus TaxID=1328930 RepID=UPI001C267E4B|nr:hypothetical protein [Desertibacillus haloalkaliphilus]MBU8907431.1 hypothetical protein [Desertibacillus haloalkaliphilus]